MEEQELLKQAKTDELAVEKLLSKYKPLVIKIARRYFLLSGNIDDLVQEGTIGLYKAIKSFDASKDASFKTFATLCIKRQLQSLIRKEHSLKNSVFYDILDSELLENLNLATNAENPEMVAISNQNMEYINSQIKLLLSKFEYEILQKYLSGKSYNQIAEEAGVSKKSVDNALHRLRSKLSHLLDDISK